jgi:hypothetical protein
LIVRLPGLFGQGLKKNVIYDFLNNNNVDQIHWGGTFQFYDLELLSTHIDRALAHHLPLVNLATEAVTVEEIARQCFGLTEPNLPDRPAAVYDMHTRYAAELGGSGNYLLTHDEVLSRISAYVATQRAS